MTDEEKVRYGINSIEKLLKFIVDEVNAITNDLNIVKGCVDKLEQRLRNENVEEL